MTGGSSKKEEYHCAACGKLTEGESENGKLTVCPECWEKASQEAAKNEVLKMVAKADKKGLLCMDCHNHIKDCTCRPENKAIRDIKK